MTDFLIYMSGSTGRVIRIVAGLVLIALGISLGGSWLGVAAFGVLPTATGVFGLCPIAPLKGLPVTAKALRNLHCPEG